MQDTPSATTIPVPPFLAEAATEGTSPTQDKNYTFVQKEAFVQKMHGKLAKLNQDLEHMAASIEKSSAAVKAEAQPKHQALREQTAKLHRQIDTAIAATESTWDDVMTGSRKTCEELKAGFQHARQWISDKIAP